MTPGPVDVLVVDDHREFREGLRALLGTVDHLRVVGEAADGSEAVVAVARLQPDVVLMDLGMPGLDGVEATRRITSTSPHVGVVVLTMTADDDAVVAAIQAGARGYLLKGARKADIVRAVDAVANGEAVLGPVLAQRLASFLAPAAPAPDPRRLFPQLSARELDVLTLMAAHLTNPEIARRLGLSEKTVRNNVSTVLTKLGVADRAQAVVQARDAGLARPA